MKSLKNIVSAGVVGGALALGTLGCNSKAEANSVYDIQVQHSAPGNYVKSNPGNEIEWTYDFSVSDVGTALWRITYDDQGNNGILSNDPGIYFENMDGDLVLMGVALIILILQPPL